MKPHFLAIILITLLATVLRFVALDQSPPGFYSDEAAISAQVICLRQSGADNSHSSWPLFSEVLAGGYATPATLYLGAAWTALFGDSIAAFRSVAAVHGALTIIGVFVLALALWQRRDSAWLAALCCALSPWGFQFSRIAWDPALAPCYFVWGFALILLDGRWPKTRGTIGGMLLALACYSYPPLRLQAALLVPIVAIIAAYGRPRARSAYALAAVAFSIACFPLIRLTVTGELQGRFNVLSITNKAYLDQFGGFSIPLVIRIFFENMALNLSPRYLFWSGDDNMRHATQAVGQWGWLEILALACSGVLLLKRKSVERRSDAVILLCLVWAYLSGVIPSAMTWESNPHALRSIGAYPFLCLTAGYILSRTSDLWPATRYVIVTVAAAFAIFYFSDFFWNYPERSQAWFETSIVAAARGPAPEEAVHAIDPNYPALALRYYELSSGQARCAADVSRPATK